MSINQHENEDVISSIRPYFEVDEQGLKRIGGVLASGKVTNHGSYVQDFERLLAEFLGVKETVAVSTGSDGLLLALKALSLPRGKAILPAYTYIATLNAVVHAGLDPIFCEIESGSFTMDTRYLAQLIQRHSDVRCVLPVNVFGIPPDVSSIQNLCEAAGARLLYDNAHGFGTESNGSRVAPEAEVQVFSFHATKTLPAVEGGLIVTENPDILSMVKRLRNHGLAPSAFDTVPGFNAKMDEIRAIIGTHSLNHFSETLSRRRSYGHRLTKCFQQFKDVFTVQRTPPNVNTNFQNLGVCCPRASQAGLGYVLDLFRSRGVGVRSYFDPPLYRIGGFNHVSALPVTELVWKTLISFPIHSRMTEKTLRRLEEAISQVAKVIRSLS